MTLDQEATATTMAAVRRLVGQAVKAAVPPGDIVDRPAWPGAVTTWPEPTPMAGFRAARDVVRLAELEVHKYALQLRGEGVSWRELADLLEIGWSDDWSRPERAFELVAGPGSINAWSGGPTAYWHCGGPQGCGLRIIDRGPFNGNPRDDEDGHAENCRRLRSEVEAYERECDEQERRAAVMDDAYEQLPEGFARSTADRARWVQAHGGKYLGWSTSEAIAVALVLNDPEALQLHGYPKRRDAISRVVDGMIYPPDDPEEWLALIRAAATGDRPTPGGSR